jgi:pyoverdine/dityrosine biosynthesis protein Dit1
VETGGSQVRDEAATARLASDILGVMTKYSQHLGVELNISEAWAGKHIFLERVMRQIDCDEPVKMVLPSFPWKSVRVLFL